MTILALPKFKDLQANEVAATFTVPAPGGCNLNCPFCFIRLRREAIPSEQVLVERDYVEFLDGLCWQFRVGLVSLQGYEPLLPESWPYSRAILQRAQVLGIDTALVTNGTYLADHVCDLVNLGIRGVTVSIDSADPALHDLSRGTPGAFVASLRGLKAACASPLRERVLVASVLQRGKAHYLRDMQKFLGDLGIRHWVVIPVYEVGREVPGQISASCDTFVSLNTLAEEQGVKLTVVANDEIRDLTVALGGVMNRGELGMRGLKTLNQVVRVSPNGACSVGKDILKRMDSSIPVWRPEVERAGEFIRRVLGLKFGANPLRVNLASSRY